MGEFQPCSEENGEGIQENLRWELSDMLVGVVQLERNRLTNVISVTCGKICAKGEEGFNELTVIFEEFTEDFRLNRSSLAVTVNAKQSEVIEP